MDIKDEQNYNCYFRAKDSLLKSLVLNRTNKGNICVIGCGTKAIKGLEDALYIDNDPKVIEKLECQRAIVGDACALPLNDDTFNVVIMADVLEHIQQDHQAVNEAFRVLKPGGAFIFIVPAHQKLFGAHDEALGHYRRYDMEDLIKLIPDTEFLSYWNFAFYYIAYFKRKLLKSKKKDDLKLPEWLDRLFFNFLMKENAQIIYDKGYKPGLSLVGVAYK